MNVSGTSVTTPPRAFSARPAGLHTVQRGDTLWAIAEQNGTTVDALMRANPQIVNADLIYPDQLIQLPGAHARTGEPQTADAQIDTATPALPDLQLGSRGPAVSQLQQQLQAAGFDPGPVDGWFGPQTQEAVRDFQSSRGLIVDGWVGAQTRQALTAPAGSGDATPASPTVTTSAPQVNNARVQTALDFAYANQGAPYVGGASPFRFGRPGDGSSHQMDGQNRYESPRGVVGFDCSGFVVAMYREAGIDLMARGIGNTRTMHAQLPAVARQDLQPGDLIVKPGSHVVVYVGDRNGDGRAEVIESKPGGVTVSDASKFLNDPDYDIRRVSS